MRAIDATRKAPVTVPPEATIADTAALMDGSAVGCVVVVDADDRPVGIVTDRDITVRGVARRVPLEGRIDDLMTTDIVTLDADSDLRAAIDVLSGHPFRRVPLVRNGRLAGMLTVDDLLVDLVGDVANLARPVTGQVLFGHPEPAPPMTAS